ncbi:hypothetical protein L9F63_025451, partial [Diploptera punctata]
CLKTEEVLIFEPAVLLYYSLRSKDCLVPNGDKQLNCKLMYRRPSSKIECHKGCDETLDSITVTGLIFNSSKKENLETEVIQHMPKILKLKKKFSVFELQQYCEAIRLVDSRNNLF